MKTLDRQSRSVEDPALVSRRRFVGVGLLSAFGIVAHARSASAEARTTAWSSFESPLSGARLDYPVEWPLDQVLVGALKYPRQSVALRTGPPPASAAGGRPDLSGYPTDGIVLWLLHYDGIVEGPHLTSGLSSGSLGERDGEYPAFRSYATNFSGSERSFLLRLWLGRDASTETLSLVNLTIGSMSIP